MCVNNSATQSFRVDEIAFFYFVLETLSPFPTAHSDLAYQCIPKQGPEVLESLEPIQRL
jgi:hypothetical protein